MLALATLLDPDSDLQTRQLWQLLEEKCNLLGIMAAPYPHFSWAASENIEWSSARRKLDRIAHKIKPFKVKTAGLGIFNGPDPVLYVAIVKEPHLLATHQDIWKRLERNLINPQEYYAPSHWMPHITIAQGDLNPQKLACAVQELAFERMAFEVNVNNISVIYHSDESVGIKSRFELGK
ncbi:MAG TPA: 2'-5' RNA ligase family protein [Anaerolineaceae bacterium]|nr:2'-5' RNA ligase family protein [Anaerolineaceae bacterium]